MGLSLLDPLGTRALDLTSCDGYGATMLILLAWPALGYLPPRIFHVDYELTVLVDDAVCEHAGVCSCAARWEGWGQMTHAGDDWVTFTGTWSLEQSTCHPVYESWAPAAGKAYHTLRYAPNGVGAQGMRGAMRGWMVHARGNDWAPRPPGTPWRSAQRGQLWLEQPWGTSEGELKLGRTTLLTLFGVNHTVKEQLHAHYQ